MKQREITDSENVQWSCVQAYAGSDGAMSAKIEKLSESENGDVDVICTPSGGAQSVRVKISKDWEDLPDDNILKAIESAK